MSDATRSTRRGEAAVEGLPGVTRRAQVGAPVAWHLGRLRESSAQGAAPEWVRDVTHEHERAWRTP